ncbi:MAG: hypothetical protein CMF46_05690 [Legionellales bacterium]|nr:hypothetical protein [Legionellales bacterium]
MKISRVNYHSPATGQAVVESLQKNGFCILVNPPLDDQLVEYNYQLWHKWFQQTGKQKGRFAIMPGKIGGYAINREKAQAAKYPDHKEIFDCYRHTKLPNELKQSTFQLSSALHQIGAECIKWIENHCKLSRPLTQIIDHSNRSVLRVAYYPALTGLQAHNQRVSPHTDINMLTIQPAPSSEGLQACDINGVWHDIPLNPNQVIIKIGDMLSKLTNGQLISTTHRVISPVNVRCHIPRIATPFFLHCQSKVKLSNQHTSDSYLTERLQEIELLDADCVV